MFGAEINRFDFVTFVFCFVFFVVFFHSITGRTEQFYNLSTSLISGPVFRLYAKLLGKPRSGPSFSTRRSTDTRPETIRDRVRSRPRTVRWPRPLCLP